MRCARSRRTPSPTSRASACSATPTRPRFARGVRIVLDGTALPALPGALELARAGVRTGGDRRNREFAAAHVTARPRPSSRRSGTTHRPQAGCSSRSRRRSAPCSRRPSPGAGCRSARGRVEEGSGVSLEQREAARAAPRAGRSRPVPPDRDGLRRRARARRHLGRVRPTDRLGPRLRQLAAVRRHAVPREGLPRDGRVRQPRGGAGRDPRRAA